MRSLVVCMNASQDHISTTILATRVDAAIASARSSEDGARNRRFMMISMIVLREAANDARVLRFLRTLTIGPLGEASNDISEYKTGSSR